MARPLQEEPPPQRVRKNLQPPAGRHDSPALFYRPATLVFSTSAGGIPFHQTGMGTGRYSAVAGHRVPALPNFVPLSERLAHELVRPRATAERKGGGAPFAGDRTPAKGIRSRMSRPGLPGTLPKKHPGHGVKRAPHGHINTERFLPPSAEKTGNTTIHCAAGSGPG